MDDGVPKYLSHVYSAQKFYDSPTVVQTEVKLVSRRLSRNNSTVKNPEDEQPKVDPEKVKEVEKIDIEETKDQFCDSEKQVEEAELVSKISSVIMDGNIANGLTNGNAVEKTDAAESTAVLREPSLSLQNNGELKEELFDPWCDPKNPKVIQFQDVSAAAFKIKTGIMNTPCMCSHISDTTGVNVYFKKDFLQYTGSFKERGARYTLMMLSESQRKIGVIAASAGNHALALSYHGKELGIPVTVVMPTIAPIMKVRLCSQYGANVIMHGRDIGESKEHAMGLAKISKQLYINGYDHPHIIAGQGTLGLEIIEQVKDLDAVVVPIGGGGLIAGIALAVKSLMPEVKVIGVESERCASFTAALKHGAPVSVRAESTLADGLAVPKVGVNAFATAAPLVDKVVVVKEEYIAIAILRLVELEKAVVEGAGAIGLAAIIAGLLPELAGKKVVVPLCGGNIDTTVLGRCLERGLAVDGRLVKFTVTVSDRPGGIAELTRLLADHGASVKDIIHERTWLKSDVYSVEVKVLCETRDYTHAQTLKRIMEEHYANVIFRCFDEHGNAKFEQLGKN